MDASRKINLKLCCKSLAKILMLFFFSFLNYVGNKITWHPNTRKQLFCQVQALTDIGLSNIVEESFIRTKICLIDQLSTFNKCRSKVFPSKVNQLV